MVASGPEVLKSYSGYSGCGFDIESDLTHDVIGGQGIVVEAGVEINHDDSPITRSMGALALASPPLTA